MIGRGPRLERAPGERQGLLAHWWLIYAAQECGTGRDLDRACQGAGLPGKQRGIAADRGRPWVDQAEAEQPLGLGMSAAAQSDQECGPSVAERLVSPHPGSFCETRWARRWRAPRIVPNGVEERDELGVAGLHCDRFGSVSAIVVDGGTLKRGAVDKKGLGAAKRFEGSGLKVMADNQPPQTEMSALRIGYDVPFPF